MVNDVVYFVLRNFITNASNYFVKTSLFICCQVLQPLSFNQSFQHRKIIFNGIIIWTVNWRHAVSKIQFSHRILYSLSSMNFQVVHKDDHLLFTHDFLQLVQKLNKLLCIYGVIIHLIVDQSHVQRDYSKKGHCLNSKIGLIQNNIITFDRILFRLVSFLCEHGFVQK